jgi:hypothetical protein
MSTIYAAAIALFWQQFFTRLIFYSPSAGSPSPPTCSPVVDRQPRPLGEIDSLTHKVRCLVLTLSLRDLCSQQRENYVVASARRPACA